MYFNTLYVLKYMYTVADYKPLQINELWSFKQKQLFKYICNLDTFFTQDITHR